MFTQKQVEADSWIATQFMNQVTFSDKEIAYYPYKQRKRYIACWNDSEDDSLNFFATDDTMAIRYLKDKFTGLPDSLERVETTFIPVATQ